MAAVIFVLPILFFFFAIPTLEFDITMIYNYSIYYQKYVFRGAFLKNLAFEVNAITDKGCVRNNNEDNFFVNGFYLMRGKPDNGFCYKETLFAPFCAGVSDGMGGEKCGEEASLIAAGGFDNFIRSYQNKVDEAALRDCVAFLNRKVFKGAPKSGATVSAVYAAEDKIYAVSLGDSRIYLLSDGKFSQISTDHTLAQLQVAAGVMSAEEAKTSNLRHGLTQFLGTDPDEMIIEPSISVIDGLSDGDIILICSDGLYDMLDDDEIKSILSAGSELKKATKKLVDVALKRGGKDNITVMTVKKS